MLLFSCKKEKVNDIKNGEMTILADESFKNVTDALAERYMSFYPDSKIITKYEKEEIAWNNFLNEKASTIVLSRTLSDAEKKTYTDKFDIPFQQSNFAGDAVVFVVPKNASKESITIEEITKELQSDSKNIIFDGSNASNLNFVTQKLKMEPKNAKFSVIRGNEELINEIEKYPNHIGVVSLNSISRIYDPEIQKLRDKIKILPVIEKGISYEPSMTNIRDMKYPFTRILYFLTNEGFFGLSRGFIRFSCTQIGQIVVKKSGLQPYNIYKREVMMR